MKVCTDYHLKACDVLLVSEVLQGGVGEVGGLTEWLLRLQVPPSPLLTAHLLLTGDPLLHLGLGVQGLPVPLRSCGLVRMERHRNRTHSLLSLVTEE